jgi:hypothetical protein
MLATVVRVALAVVITSLRPGIWGARKPWCGEPLYTGPSRQAHRMAYPRGEAPFIGWPAAGEGNGAACSVQGSSHLGVPWRKPNLRTEQIQEIVWDLFVPNRRLQRGSGSPAPRASSISWVPGLREAAMVPPHFMEPGAIIPSAPG